MNIRFALGVECVTLFICCMRLGVVLPAVATAALWSAPLLSQERGDGSDVAASLHAQQVVAQAEFIEVSHEDLTALLRAAPPAADATGLRRQVQDLVRDGRAKIVETIVGVAVPGAKARVGSAREHIYPTEYELPETPNKVSLGFAEGDAQWAAVLPQLVTPPTPTAFVTRHAGSDADFKSDVDERTGTITLSLSAEVDALTGLKEWLRQKDGRGGEGVVAMPLFFSNRIATRVTLRDGEYALAGVLSPRGADGEVDFTRKLMVFVKGNLAVPGGGQRAERAGAPRPDVLVRAEMIEVDHARLTALMSERGLVANGARLRERLQVMVGTGEARIHDTLVARTTADEKASLHSVREWIYPIEYDPPVLPGPAPGASGIALAPPHPHAEVPSIPTAFETRDTGVGFEVQPVLRRDRRSVSLKWGAECVSLRAIESFGKRKSPGGSEFDLAMPHFETVRPGGTLVLTDGATVLAAVARRDQESDKRLLVMIRCDVLR